MNLLPAFLYVKKCAFHPYLSRLYGFSRQESRVKMHSSLVLYVYVLHYQKFATMQAPLEPPASPCPSAIMYVHDQDRPSSPMACSACCHPSLRSGSPLLPDPSPSLRSGLRLMRSG